MKPFMTDCNSGHIIKEWGSDNVDYKLARIISHFQSYVEAFEEKIDEIQEQIAENVLQEDLKKHLAHLNAKEEQPCFKEMWVYKTKHDDDVLVGAISNEDTTYPIKGINLTSKKGVTFTLEGFYRTGEKHRDDLIVSTGKKWEPT